MPNKLTEEEARAYLAIKDCCKGTITRKQVCEMLGKSERTVFRLIEKYREEGKDGFSHGLKGVSPKNRTDIAKERELAEFYESEYFDFNFSHFCDFVREMRPKNAPSFFYDLTDITVRRMLLRQGIKPPSKAKKKKKKKSHPVRPRRPSFGELVQIDASLHDWLRIGEKLALHVAIDDATSEIVAACFKERETLEGYFEALYQMLSFLGVPSCLYADNRSGFEERSKEDPLRSNAHFMRALKELGIEMRTTSVPEAKGRVERTFRTHQDRLISEMRIMKVGSLSEANQYLFSYMKRHNERFAMERDGLPSSFMPVPKGIDINKTLCRSFEREVLSGNVISIMGSQYRALNEDGELVTLPEGDKVMAGVSFDGEPFVRHGGKYYDVQLMRKGRATAHRPSDSHPWRKGYGKSLDEQKW
jgi:transposase